MNNFEDIDLHDGVLKSFSIDFDAATLKIYVDYYESENSSVRRRGCLFFKGVGRFSHLSDMGVLRKNAFAGNVGYWRLNMKDGSAYIYLVDGLIEVGFQEVSLLHSE